MFPSTYRDNHQSLIQSTIDTYLQAINLEMEAHGVIEIHCLKATGAYPNGIKRPVVGGYAKNLEIGTWQH